MKYASVEIATFNNALSLSVKVDLELAEFLSSLSALTSKNLFLLRDTSFILASLLRPITFFFSSNNFSRSALVKNLG